MVQIPLLNCLQHGEQSRLLGNKSALIRTATKCLDQKLLFFFFSAHTPLRTLRFFSQVMALTGFSYNILRLC